MMNVLGAYKNRFLFLILFCTFFCTTILAEDNVLYEEKDYRTSHWSLGVQGGLSFLDGDISQHNKELMTFFSNPDLEWNVDVYGEYSINPLVGLGLEYRYTRMGQANTALQSNGDMHELAPYASISLNKLLTMSSRPFKWNLLFKLGMGIGYYQIFTESLNGSIAEKVTYGDLKGISLMLPLGLGYEYNVSDNWSIGAYYDYRYSLATDLLDAKMAGTSNDGLHELTLGVRYKFKAKKFPHNKNISWRLYRNKQLMKDVAEGKLKPQDITDKTIDSHLATNYMPDPDLLIRTGGEIRLSNYLLWQCAYSELYFCDTFWPDFKEAELRKAICDYQKRERRFGKTSEQI